ncbi:MAG: glyoxalase, partial [Flavobacterium sp.]
MNHNAKSIRPFIGAKDFDVSRSFYIDLGFEETALGGAMSVFKSGDYAFYLQNYYAKEWVDNTMVFMEVDDVNRFWKELVDLNLPEKYPSVR